jgi:hypothetical protein
LWDNFIMQEFMNVDRTMSILFTFEWTLLHLGYVGSGELFESEDFNMVSVLCMWTIHSSSPVILERNSEFSLKAMAFLNMDLILLLFAEYEEHKFGSSAMHVQFVLQNALNCPRWNYHQTSSLMDSNSSIFKDLFPTFKSVFPSQRMSCAIHCYQQRSHCCLTQKTLKTHIVCPPTALSTFSKQSSIHIFCTFSSHMCCILLEQEIARQLLLCLCLPAEVGSSSTW